MLQFKKTLVTLEAKAIGKKVVRRLLLDNESLLTPEVTVTMSPIYEIPALVYEGKTNIR